MKMIRLKILGVALLATTVVANAELPAIELTPEWVATIQKAAPEKPAVSALKTRKALLFSAMTGFKHWCTPHTAEMLKILGKKSGAYEVVESNDANMFAPENIKQFDIIILNNNCSDRKKRDMFWDITKDAEKAAMLEKSFIDHIAAGHGLVAFHGAITMQNNSPEFSKMLGGSFDYHPKQQDVTCNPVDPSHPIVRHFKGKPLIHHDEPYIFKNAYNEKNFHPLLEMDCSKMGAKVQSDKRYVSWIKKHKQGRVFYCSPSHNAHSFEKPELLQFILNGIQYAAGDLKCDDRPLKK